MWSIMVGVVCATLTGHQTILLLASIQRFDKVSHTFLIQKRFYHLYHVFIKYCNLYTILSVAKTVFYWRKRLHLHLSCFDQVELRFSLQWNFEIIKLLCLIFFLFPSAHQFLVVKYLYLNR